MLLRKLPNPFQFSSSERNGLGLVQSSIVRVIFECKYSDNSEYYSAKKYIDYNFNSKAKLKYNFAKYNLKIKSVSD